MTVPVALTALGFLVLACGLGLVHLATGRRGLRGGILGIALATIFQGGFFIGGGLMLMEVEGYGPW